MKILIVEDEKLLAKSIQLLLKSNGFESDIVFDGQTGYEYAKLGIYDLIISDIMMPKMNGYELTKKIRQEHIGTPILMLTAKSQVDDRISGLNSGADYYLTKPFNTNELLACINALLRRQGSQVSDINYGNTSLNLSSATLHTGKDNIRLSSKEFDIIRLLFGSGENITSKETILTKVWGFDSNAVENHVEVYIGFLRKKLSSIGSNISIVAVRKLGYTLEVKRND